MNKYINRFFILAGMGLALAACSENDWNDKLDGFEVPDKNPSETVNYTMTDVDFAQLAKSSDALKYAGDYADEFKAMCAQGAFNSQFPAETYLPFFLAQPTCPYFSLPEGSAIKVTYRTSEDQTPQQVGAINADKYTVTEADYQSVWGSDTDFAEAFTPSKTAAKNIPAILKANYANPDSGDYVIVTYKVAPQDPVFGGGGSTPEEPAFQPSSVLGTIAKGDVVDIKGYVAAISSQGPIVTDASGSVFVYLPTNNSDLKVGDQVEIPSAKVDTYNYAFQIAKGTTAEVVGTQAVTYPSPKEWTPTEIETAIADAMASGGAPIKPIYSKFTGTVVVSGNYINIKVDGTDKQLSPYGLSTANKALFTDGATVTFEGYAMAAASKGAYLNVVVTKVGSTAISTLAVASKATAADSRAGVTLATETELAVYWFDGTKWASPSDMYILNHADYQAMGQSYDNLSGTGPETYLPMYLKQTFPYALEGDLKYIVYTYYNGSSNVTRCDECIYTAGEWQIGYGSTNFITSQFVKKGGQWKYSPDVEITLPAGRNIEISTLYFQACVDWVLANVPDGAKYVTSYGNNDYYTGASAYQGNVDLRPDKARDQYAEGYADMTDDEIVEIEKKRLVEEVFPGVLAELHPDMAPTASGVQPYFTINFYYYTGSATLPAQVVYQVVAKGTFKFVSQEWSE